MSSNKENKSLYIEITFHLKSHQSTIKIGHNQIFSGPNLAFKEN